MSGEKEAETPPGRHIVRRRLTEDEEDLWAAVVRTAKPLRGARKATPAGKQKSAGAAGGRPLKKSATPGTLVVKSRPVPASPPVTTVIARRERQQLARGRAAIDARIDLHGMTQAQAHDALVRFLHRSQARGAKFVLVITGKGAPNALRADRGVLRRQVPLWLALPELRGCVLGFDVAHIGHGGEGALYVRLRKVATR
jgi:DNA-nicking Smr family endonuclease